MIHLFKYVVAAVALGAAAPGVAAAASAHEEAAIPFVDDGAVRNWRAVDRDTLLIESSHGRWYRAELFSPAHDLPFAQAIGFDARPDGTLDRFSAVVVRGQRYPLTSLVEVPKPPKKSREATKPQA